MPLSYSIYSSCGITYVVPVALALLHGATSEAEGASPVASGLGRVAGKWELSLVAVPGAEQVDGLALSGGSESERELKSGHFD